MGIGDTYQESNTASIRENFEWDRLWWEHTEDNTKKRVLVIGDSISSNFRWRMVDELKGEIHPDGFSSSKALDNPYLLESIKLFNKQSPKYDAVYVNNGLHGWHLSADEYKKYYKEYLTALKELFGEAQLFVGLTTPVRNKENMAEFGERNVEVLKRNQAALEIAGELDLKTIDMYSVLLDHPDLCTDGVHQTEEGNTLLAKKVIEEIKKYI